MSACQKALIGLTCLCMLGEGAAAERVPPPWTPVSVKSDAAGAEVGVWGRKCRFANAPSTTIILWIVGLIVTALNILLIVDIAKQYLF